MRPECPSKCNDTFFRLEDSNSGEACATCRIDAFPHRLYICAAVLRVIDRTTNRCRFADATSCNIFAAISTFPVLVTGALAWHPQLESQRIQGVLLRQHVLACVSSVMIWLTGWMHFRAPRLPGGLPKRCLAIELLAVVAIVLTGHLGRFLSGVNRIRVDRLHHGREKTLTLRVQRDGRLISLRNKESASSYSLAPTKLSPLGRIHTYEVWSIWFSPGLMRAVRLLPTLTSGVWSDASSPATAADASYWETVIFPMLLTITGGTIGSAELHCACLARGDDGLLVAGPSGSGKSTLALSLAQIGFSFLSDAETFRCAALAILTIAAMLRSTSLSVVAQQETLIRITKFPCHSVPPHQQVPSR